MWSHTCCVTLGELLSLSVPCVLSEGCWQLSSHMKPEKAGAPRPESGLALLCTHQGHAGSTLL